MDPEEIPGMIVSVIYTAIQFALAVLMYKKIKKGGSRDLVHLFMVFVMMAAVAMFMPFQSIFIAILQPFSAIFLLPFIKAIFYRQKRSWYKQMLAISAVLHVLVVLLKLAREWFKRVLVTDPPELFFAYNFVMFFIFFISFGWFTALCIRTRSHLVRARSVEPWIVKRYDLVALSAVLILFATSIPLLFHTDLAFHSGIVPKLILGIFFLSFSVTSFFAWFMPTRIKRYFNRNHAKQLIGETGQSEQLGEVSIKAKLDTKKIAAIIDYLGNKLAIEIAKTPAAAKGLLLMAIDSDNAILNQVVLDLAALHEIITGELKRKLEMLGFTNSLEITQTLANELKENQSLILMQSI
jgi:hypothetical protein